MGEGAKKPSAVRKVLLYGVLAVGVLGLGAVGVAFKAYEAEHAPDRSHPELVVEQFVRADLNRRDSAEASLFACSGDRGSNTLADLRAQIESDEKANGVSTQVTVRYTESRDDGKQVIADLQLAQTAGGLVTREVQRWTFNMTKEDGWRVCGAERLPEPVPTPSATDTTATPPTTPSPPLP